MQNETKHPTSVSVPASIPTSWKEVSIRTLQNYVKLIESKKQSASTDSESYNYICQVLEVFTGKEEGFYRDYPISQINEMASKLKWIGKLPELAENDVLPNMAFKINNKIYAFDMRLNMTVAQLDDEEKLSSSQKYKYDNLHYIMAMFVRPAQERGELSRIMRNLSVKSWSKKHKQVIHPKIINLIANYDIKKYNSDEVEERGLMFLDSISAHDAIMLDFFLQGLKQGYSNYIQDYSWNQKIQVKSI